MMVHASWDFPMDLKLDILWAFLESNGDQNSFWSARETSSKDGKYEAQITKMITRYDSDISPFTRTHFTVVNR